MKCLKCSGNGIDTQGDILMKIDRSYKPPEGYEPSQKKYVCPECGIVEYMPKHLQPLEIDLQKTSA